MEDLVIPILEWHETVAWVERVRDVGVERVWFDDENRDPIVFVAALAQRVDVVRFGIKASALRDRPAVLAWKQLVTLDLLSGGRIEVGMDDRAFGDAIRAGEATGLLPHPCGLQFLACSF